jgi:hypothetical protein
VWRWAALSGVQGAASFSYNQLRQRGLQAEQAVERERSFSIRNSFRKFICVLGSHFPF